MSLLIDTQILLWWLSDDKKLSQTSRNLIATSETVSVSIASLWEIVIKESIGKLTVDLVAMFDFIPTSGFNTYPIQPNHLLTLSSLPHHHRDPFDRVIISQALSDRLTIVTSDHAFDQYKVPVVFN
ncbi:MAG: type II toxin-antitoxin system VapC family toxin [Pseudomonadota bacterium]